MEQFTELFGCDEKSTLKFFYDELRNIIDSDISNIEVLYPASVLAHYAQVSCACGSDFPMQTDLTGIFDNFVLSTMFPHRDWEIAEIAGAQILLHVGYFRDQASYRGRHNLQWYQELGVSFFARSANFCPDPPKKQILRRTAVNFSLLTDAYCELSRDLRDRPYLIRPPTPPPAS